MMKKVIFILVVLTCLARLTYGQDNLQINQTGFAFNMGVNIHDFSSFNQANRNPELAPLNNYCTTGGIEYLFGNPKLMWSTHLGVFANVLTNYQETKHTNYSGYRIGARLMRNIFEKKAFQSRFCFGLYGSQVFLSTVDGSVSNTGWQFIDRFTESRNVSYMAKPRMDMNLGITLEYLPDWFIANKAYRREFINIVLELGHMRNIRSHNKLWWKGGGYSFAHPPKLNTNNFYMLMTYRFMFDSAL